MSSLSLVDFPVEVLHRIFDYLNTQTIFCSLRSTCRQLCATVYTYDRYELDLNSIRRFDSDLVFDLIRPENIVSMIVSGANRKQFDQIDWFLSIWSSKQLIRLRSLTLLEIVESDLDLLLPTIEISLIVSLGVRCCATYRNRTIPLVSTAIAQSRLRQLHLVGLYDLTKSLSWPAQCSLQHLTLDTCSFQEYRFVLQCCPSLRTVAMQYCRMSESGLTTSVSCDNRSYPRITSFTMTICYLSLDDIDLLLSLTPSLTRLKLLGETGHGKSLLDGSQWEALIQKTLPHLQNFEFCFRRNLGVGNDSQDLHSIIKHYQTPFWLETKRWAVTCDCVIQSRSSQLMIHTSPVPIDGLKLLIRCRASSMDATCHFMDVQLNENGHGNLESDLTKQICMELDLDDTYSGSRCLPYLACALKHTTILVKLNLSRSNIDSKSIEPLARILDNNATLLTLNLDSNRIEPQDILRLTEVLHDNTTLTMLSVGGNRIGQNGTQHLCDLLRKNTTLTELRIGANHIGPSGIVLVGNALQDNITLTALDLQDNDIGDEGVQHLSDALKTNRTLLTLDLSSNQITAAGAAYLATMLAGNTTLITLSLNDNELEGDGAEYLACALQKNRAMKTLNLRFNRIDDSGAIPLANSLSTNTTLTTLNLWNNQIKSAGSRCLSEALRENTILTTLDLGRNQIGTSGTKHFADMLRTNSTLLVLNLWDNRIGDKGAEHLAIALELNTALTTLDIGFNKIADDGARHLARALQINKVLTKLNLDYNPIVADVVLLINSLLKRHTGM